MGNRVTGKSFLPIVVVFVLLSLFIWLAGPLLEAWKADRMVLAGGNVLLFFVTLVSFGLYSKSLRSTNVHAFVRVMYGSLLIKMLVCLIATFIYASAAGRAVNRNGVIGCFVFYILYTFFEVKILMELTRTQGKTDHA
jgi:FlaA1/EpsC-like NDP-sugar epimerase